MLDTSPHPVPSSSSSSLCPRDVQGRYSLAARGVTLAAAAACIILAVLTVHIRGANTCLAYRIAHLQSRGQQWSEHSLSLKCRLGKMVAPKALEVSLGAFVSEESSSPEEEDKPETPSRLLIP